VPDPLTRASKSALVVISGGVTAVHGEGHEVKSEASNRYCPIELPQYMLSDPSIEIENALGFIELDTANSEKVCEVPVVSSVSVIWKLYVEYESFTIIFPVEEKKALFMAPDMLPSWVNGP